MSLLVAEVEWFGPDVDPVPGIAQRLGIDPGTVLSAQLLRRTVDGRRRPPRWLANYLVELSSGEAEVLAK